MPRATVDAAWRRYLTPAEARHVAALDAEIADLAAQLAAKVRRRKTFMRRANTRRYTSERKRR